MTDEVAGNMATLIAKAKEAGVKGAHLYKTEAKLEAAIAKAGKPVEPKIVSIAEAVEPSVQPRKKAPKMNASNINRDDREELISRLEREDPDCKYCFEKADISDAKLAAKGFERTGHSVRNDIVVRTDKKSFAEYYNTKRDAQTRLMKSVDTDGTRIKSYTEAPKTGT